MVRTISAAELAKHLSDVLNRVHYRREQFVIERNGDPVASLGPVPSPIGLSIRELTERLGSLILPGDGFADDLEAVQAAQPKFGTPKP